VRASGLAYAGETGAGHHFVGADGLGVRYGAATWVDASGRRTPLTTTWENGRLAITAPAALVDASPYPVEIDPTISAEFGTDNPVPYPEAGTHAYPSVAFNGSTYLVAWEATNAKDTIECARVSASGQLLDFPPATLGTVTQDYYVPTVASLGTDWLVVWPNDLPAGDTVNGAIVHADGTRTPVLPIAVPSTVLSAAVASDGASHYYVAFTNDLGAASGELLDASGNPVSGSEQPLPPGYGVALAYSPANGGEYLAALGGVIEAPYTAAAVNAQRIHAADGSLLGSALTVSTSGTSPPRLPVVAAGPSQFFVGWSVPLASPPNVVGGRVVNADGSLDPIVGFGDSSTVAAQPQTVAATYVAGNFALAWVSQTGPSTSTISMGVVSPSTGAVVAKSTVETTATNKTGPALAPGLLLWSDDGTIDGSINGGAPFVVSADGNPESNPQVAWASQSNEWLVVWSDQRNTPAQGWAARVSSAGTVLDTSGIGFATSGPSLPVMNPKVASNGTDFYVTWATGSYLYTSGTGIYPPSQVYAELVRANGTAAGAGAVCSTATCGASQVSPVIASNGNGWFLAWADTRFVSSSGTGYDLNSTNIGFAGGAHVAMVIAGDQIPEAAAWAPAAHNSSGDYLVGYLNQTTSTLTSAAIFNPSWVLGVRGGGVQNTAGGPASPYPMSIASDGTNFLLVDAENNHAGGYGITGANGALAATLQMSPFSSIQLNPSVTWTGSNYWTVWEDNINAGLTAEDIYGARVSSAFKVVDATPVLLSNDVGNEHTPAIATGPSNVSLLAYQAPVPSVVASRVKLRTIDDRSPQGSPCTSPGECTTGACVDGFCCNQVKCAGCEACSNAKTGQANGTCANVIDGTDPNRSCRPTGGGCATDACQGGACTVFVTSGSCYIQNACWSSGAPNPTASCLTCDPAVSQTGWTQQSGTCNVGGTCYQAGAPEPGNACFTCQPSTSPTSFTAIDCDDGLTCTRDSCSNGSCVHTVGFGSCDIGNACYSAGQPNPSNACQFCSPANPTAWTTVPGCVGDAGVPPSDSGMPPSDSGMPPSDSGMPPSDSGMPPSDSGMPPSDSGMPPSDSGMPPSDSGMPPSDSGMPPSDSGVPPSDSGMPPSDSGVPPSDSGGDDSGSVGNDSGSGGDDSGSVGNDSGGGGDDSGSAGDDSGSAGNDSGAGGDDSGATLADSGDDGGEPPLTVDPSAGCGCRVVPQHDPSFAWVGAGLALVAVARRRRRRER
jgi:MYXO-CTERM domain-containing protein